MFELNLWCSARCCKWNPGRLQNWQDMKTYDNILSYSAIFCSSTLRSVFKCLQHFARRESCRVPAPRCGGAAASSGVFIGMGGWTVSNNEHPQGPSSGLERELHPWMLFQIQIWRIFMDFRDQKWHAMAITVSSFLISRLRHNDPPLGDAGWSRGATTGCLPLRAALTETSSDDHLMITYGFVWKCWVNIPNDS